MTPEERALLMVYASVRGRIQIGVDKFFEAVKDFQVVPLTEQGEVIGGVLLKRNEIHVGCSSRPKGVARKYIRATLNSILKDYGHAVTSVQADNPAGLRFCERLGFVKYAEQNGTIWLRCDRSNYA